MPPSPQLAPPGSSSYGSNTLHVGDGTWDSTRDDFLLPPLVGLNFATMRYNGMGNRFFTMASYHSLVEAHGIIAAITFLGLVPAAIMLARFYRRNPRQALRLHIWLNITTLLLVNVVFILGWFIVGQKRSLTNPHHGIGLALYILIWFQVLGGAFVHHRERGRARDHVPLKVMLHHWLGRAIALLGITQVALGLTLYGSPVSLFVLYTLFVFGLLVSYFILTYVYQQHVGDYESRGSHVSKAGEDRRQDHSGPGWGRVAAAGAAGAGLAALWNRQRRRSHANDGATDESGTDYLEDEKYSDKPNHGWGRRLLGVGAIAGGIAAARSLFRRKNREDDASDVGPYRPPLGGNQSIGSDSVSRIEEGRPPINRPVTPQGNSPGYVRPTHPLANPPMTAGSAGRRDSADSYSQESFTSGSPSRQDRRKQRVGNTVAAGGGLFGVRQLFKSRRQKREERRQEELRAQRVQEERTARMNSQRKYTGDGVTPPRRSRTSGLGGSPASVGGPGHVVDDRNHRPEIDPAMPIAGVGAAAAGALAERDRIRPVGTDPPVTLAGGPTSMPLNMPPIPPTHRSEYNSSGSEIYTTASGRQHHRHHSRNEAVAGFAGGGLAAAAADVTRRRASGRNTDSMESPPVSVKINLRNDGRQVTLRRLTEEEAAAQREAIRQEEGASSGRRRRNSSFSSASGGEYHGGRDTSADRRWRRAEAIEQQQAAQNQAAAGGSSAAYGRPPPHIPTTPYHNPNQTIDPRTGHPINVPPPPPIPGSMSGLGGPSASITSPGTETSGATEYANNRRRRRAERAQAKLAREGRAGANTVEFT